MKSYFEQTQMDPLHYAHNIKANSNSTFSTGGNGVIDYSTTTVSANNQLYSDPELMDTIITSNTIEFVYKQQYLGNNGFFVPQTSIYKVVYSRWNGGKDIVYGVYNPGTDESYEF